MSKPPRRELKSTESVPFGLPEDAATKTHGVVLVIDHDDDARRVTADGLRRLGWRVSEARDVRTGVEVALDGQPIAIITELEFPNVHGYSFVRSLRSVVDHDVQLVALTGLAEAHFGEARAAGFDVVFAK